MPDLSAVNLRGKDGLLVVWVVGYQRAWLEAAGQVEEHVEVYPNQPIRRQVFQR